MSSNPAFVENLIILAIFFGFVCLLLCIIALVFKAVGHIQERNLHKKAWYAGTIKETVIDQVNIQPKSVRK